MLLQEIGKVFVCRFEPAICDGIVISSAFNLYRLLDCLLSSVTQWTKEAKCSAERRCDVPGPNSLLRAARDRSGPEVHSADVQKWDPR